MADRIVSVNTLDEFFADLVTSFLGMEADKVLISYESMGQMHPVKGHDYCFIHTSEVPDDVQNQKNRTEALTGPEEYTISQTSMRKIKVDFMFYGPNADTNSIVFKEKLYFPGTNLLLSDNNLALIPTEIDFTNLNEEINNTFWQRSDLSVNFYTSVTFEETTGIIKDLDLSISTQ